MTFSPGTNYYFDNFGNEGEQGLWEDLIIESIKIYGIDVYYIPRVITSYDPILGEDDTSQFNVAIPIEMYIKSVDGFEGDGAIFQKFGVEIRDQVTFTVAKRIWEEEVGPRVTNSVPNQGDLIYFPLNKKLFQIKFTDYKPFFYQHGALQTYDLKCELFEYSNEDLATGIPDIDELQVKYSTDIFDYAMLSEDGLMIADNNGYILVGEGYNVGGGIPAGDESADNEEIQDEQNADDVLNWSELDPFSQGGQY
jgi:Virus neck protein